MTSDLFVSWAQEHGIELRFIQPGKPNQNAYVERFNKMSRAGIDCSDILLNRIR